MKKIQHSLAARVPKIILQRVEEVYPALKESLQNIHTIKVENDVLIEENSTDMKSDKVYAPAACSIKEAELKQNDVIIKEEIEDVIEENSIDVETDEVDKPSACSINKVEPKQNSDSFKAENDDVIEENSIDLKTDKVYAPSVCSINKVEPKHSVDAMKIGNAVDIKGEEIASAVRTDDVYTPSAYSINEVEPQISPVLLKDVPGPSSETCNWAMNVKVEEDDPLAIQFPAVKAEPGIEEEQTLINELKKIEARKKEREKKQQDLQKLITAADCQAETKSEKKLTKKKLQHQLRPRVDPSICRAVPMPGRHAPDNRVRRLTERHFISRIPPRSTKARPQRRCVVCSKRGKRKETVFWCEACDVGLCVECFRDYHTKLNF